MDQAASGLRTPMDATASPNIGIGRCHDRIAELLALPDGWHDGGGLAVAAGAARSVTALLSARPALAEIACIYPTDEGGLLVEFIRAGWDISVEVGPTGLATLYGTEQQGPDSFDGIDSAPVSDGRVLGVLDVLLASGGGVRLADLAAAIQPGAVMPEDCGRPLNDAVWPIRPWLRFCRRRGLPWWLACAGVEAGLFVVFASILGVCILLVP